MGLVPLAALDAAQVYALFLPLLNGSVKEEAPLRAGRDGNYDGVDLNLVESAEDFVQWGFSRIKAGRLFLQIKQWQTNGVDATALAAAEAAVSNNAEELRRAARASSPARLPADVGFMPASRPSPLSRPPLPTPPSHPLPANVHRAVASGDFDRRDPSAHTAQDYSPPRAQRVQPWAFGAEPIAAAANDPTAAPPPPHIFRGAAAAKHAAGAGARRPQEYAGGQEARQNTAVAATAQAAAKAQAAAFEAQRSAEAHRAAEAQRTAQANKATEAAEAAVAKHAAAPKHNAHNAHKAAEADKAAAAQKAARAKAAAAKQQKAAKNEAAAEDQRKDPADEPARRVSKRVAARTKPEAPAPRPRRSIRGAPSEAARTPPSARTAPPARKAGEKRASKRASDGSEGPKSKRLVTNKAADAAALAGLPRKTPAELEADMLADAEDAEECGDPRGSPGSFDADDDDANACDADADDADDACNVEEDGARDDASDDASDDGGDAASRDAAPFDADDDANACDADADDADDACNVEEDGARDDARDDASDDGGDAASRDAAPVRRDALLDDEPADAASQSSDAEDDVSDDGRDAAAADDDDKKIWYFDPEILAEIHFNASGTEAAAPATASAPRGTRSVTALDFDEAYSQAPFLNKPLQLWRHVLRVNGWKYDAAHNLGGMSYIAYLAPPDDRGERRAFSPLKSVEGVLAEDSDTVDAMKSVIAFYSKGAVVDDLKVAKNLEAIEADALAFTNLKKECRKRALEAQGDDWGVVSSEATAHFQARAAPRTKRRLVDSVKGNKKSKAAKVREDRLDRAEAAEFARFSARRPLEVMDSRQAAEGFEPHMGLRVSDDVFFDSNSKRFQGQFGNWHAALTRGWGILLHGFGSKILLLRKFAEAEFHRDESSFRICVEVRGYETDLSLRSALLAVIPAWNENYGKGPMRLRRRDFEQSNIVELAAALVGAIEQRNALADRAETDDGRNSLAKDRRCCAAWPTHVYFTVHNIDGPKLRRAEAQQALSLLRTEHVHLAASVEHENAPIMWDSRLVEAFNFMWVEGDTFEAYSVEHPDVLRPDASKAVMAARPLVPAAIEQVVRSLTPRHQDILECIATYIKTQGAALGSHTLKKPLSAQTPGCLDMKQFKTLVSGRLIAQSDDGLREFLVELVSHNLISRVNKHGAEFLVMPLEHVQPVLDAVKGRHG